MPSPATTEFIAEGLSDLAEISTLKPHPRNYREHPDDQLDHLIESIREHGMYRAIVIAKDGTILAGHGVVKAAQKMGIVEVPVVRMDLDPNDVRALKLLAGDNQVEHLGIIDDRALSEILKEIAELDIDGLLGTGYDEKMLANLVMVTRPQSEIENFDAAAEWAGMPDYEPFDVALKMIVSFKDEDDRNDFIQRLDLKHTTKNSKSMWWPERTREDTSSLVVTEGDSQ